MHAPGVESVAFAPDGRTLAASWGQFARLWNLTGERPRERAELDAPMDSVYSIMNSCVAFAPDGKTLAATSMEEPVILWDLGEDQPRARAFLRGHRGSVSALGLSPDGKTVAGGEEGGTIHLWDMEGEGERESVKLEGHTGTVHALAFSPDGRPLASGSEEGTVRLWDVRAYLEEKTRLEKASRITTIPGQRKTPYIVGCVCCPVREQPDLLSS
jgi:WD40 repeat protein